MGAARAQAPGARPAWTVEGFLGGAASLPTPLTIRQSGQPDLDLTARWSTRGLRFPLYYAVRVGRRAGGRPHAWELELLHHKLYLDDPPAAVRSFEVTHGYNLLTVLRAWDAGRAQLRLGAGAVLAHAESEVRGRVGEGGGNLPGGYHLAGASLQAAVGRRLALAGRLFVAPEVKATAAWARVPVASGSATVPNVAAHLLVGLGWRSTR